jgi:multidrug efflux pump subunit AcrA (membrane-fusion protein)
MKFVKIYFLLLIVSFLSCSKKEKGIKPQLGTITEAVYASGIIKAENQYIVYATVSGILQKVHVVAGQSINENQLLFDIDRKKAEINTDNARLTYELSRENSRYIQDRLAEMEIKVQSAKDKLALSESIYKRNERIRSLEGISEIDFEAVTLNYKSAKLSFETSKKQLAQLQSQLRNEQKRNSNNLRFNQQSQEDFSIRSAFSGQLFDILVKEGALISSQTPMAIIGKANSFVIELEVDENDMVQVAIDQKIMLTMDSYKGSVYEAFVSKIYPIMDERSRTFKIEAHFINPPKKLYPNLTAEANIIIRKKENTLIIPKNYLLNQEYVIVAKDQKRKVKIGIADYQKVEILEGLTKEDLIYKPEE